MPAWAEASTGGPTVTLVFVGDINLDGLPGDLVRPTDGRLGACGPESSTGPTAEYPPLRKVRGCGGAPQLARHTLWEPP
ncbi:MAG TPA: hypothetical protein VLM84_03420 [Chromatiaceae bacterium]|nr:hypothetical protein [Chromatiaceae bacterium]